MSGKDDLRMCKVCYGDLTDVQQREQHIQDRNRQGRKGKPGVAKVAQTMQENIAYCMKVLPDYKDLAMALLDFKRRDEYDDAVAMRESILRRCQAVGVEAKKLKAANTQLKHEVDTDSFRMRGRMMARCTEFLQEHMMGMARLPKREEIESYVPPEEELEEVPPEEQAAPLGTILVEVTYDITGIRGVVPMGMLIVHVVQANGLVIENKSGVCDPFVSASYASGDGDYDTKSNEKRTKTMKKILDPQFDEELCFEEVGSLETAAAGRLTIVVSAQLGRKKSQALGKVVLPVGLAVDHGEPITIALQTPEEGAQIEAWTPFTPNQLVALQLQQMDDLQRFSIVKSVVDGMKFSEAMDLVASFVGNSSILRGNVAAAIEAGAIIMGLKDIEKLNAFNRKKLMKDLVDGKVRVNEALLLATDSVKAQEEERRQLIEAEKNRDREVAGAHAKLRRMLDTLEPVMAGRPPSPPLATDNLLENTDGVLRTSPSPLPRSRDVSLQPSRYADARCVLMSSLFQRPILFGTRSRTGLCR